MTVAISDKRAGGHLMQLEHVQKHPSALATSPLRRAPEQPPCDSDAEACCLVGMFTVPERMAHFDLTPHLVCFVEHITIWRAMKRAIGGPPDGFWGRTFEDLLRERSAPEVRALMGVLELAQKNAVVSGSDNGWLIFILSFKKLERCTAARRELSQLHARAADLYRIPDKPFSVDEKRYLLGLHPLDERVLDV